ncbi:hypothetical protein GTO91_07290 [Heliobacterium undosum]|uniref:Glycosyltransferase family 1 protein n=1 Tax=Heliomicrobium undosum TaxID=121734 RepID=A0A845L319_9FIRM|nr:glycosyltransferase family 4 protein [Heliomicrobium undosum]MZP29509.1 hypothetical protein [Heliomicrobium undosum]
MSQLLERFREVHGRNPKVLHIGNIANNSYNNAKLINGNGIDCDVLCYDYYHVMGCPEWEDADFRGDYGDDFFPNWEAVDLNGFQRPKWFVQGPLNFCIKYLDSKNRNHTIRAGFWWKVLAESRRFIRWRKKYGSFSSGKKHFIESLKKFISRKEYFSLLSEIIVFFLFTSFWQILLLLFITARCMNSIVIFSLKVLKRFKKMATRSQGRGTRERRRSLSMVSWDDYIAHCESLVREFNEHFPDRPDKLNVEELEQFYSPVNKFLYLFQHYDLVEAYSTDPIYPLLMRFKPYIAYEHGTIRDIPFDDNVVSRLTALAYAKADHVFITNPDCIKRVDDLCIKKYSFVPHVIDQKYERAPSPVRSRYGISEKSRLIFAPARQNWEIKGNDITFHAFHQYLQDYPDAYLAIPFWGQDVDKSKSLIDELKIKKNIIELEPLKIRELIDWINAADCVIDQYYGYFGGIAPSALACGKPLIMDFNANWYEWAFTEMPPVLWANTVQTVYERLIEAMKMDLNSYHAQAIQWVKENYGYEMVKDEHIAQIASLLATRGCSYD